MNRCVALTILAFTLIGGQARADGGPIIGGDAGPRGVVYGPTRYVAMMDDGPTLVLRIARRGGIVENWRSLGALRVFTVVAGDGTSVGVSGDGTVLVLADPTFPRRVSRFTILDAQRLRRVAEVTLRGDFALDAISPQGDRLYLIETLAPSHYAVRAYDVTAQQLLPDPIVDPQEADEPMTGDPLARVMSPDRRWAYTLYARPHGEPFIHALDTQAGRAKCIDLDGLGAVDELRVDKGRLLVQSSGQTVRVVDAPGLTRAHASGSRQADDGGPGRLGFAGGALALVVLAALALRAGKRTSMES